MAAIWLVGRLSTMIADAELRLVQARLTEKTVLQWVGVEGGPGDIGIVGLAPVLEEIAVASAENRLVDLVAEHVQGLAGRERPPGSKDGGTTEGGAEKTTACNS